MNAIEQVTEHDTACILCSRNCGITISTDQNGTFKKIKGDPKHPMSTGYICQKAARLEHYQNHADRLSKPLKRQADGSFQEISWDQALSEIAEKMNSLSKQHGRDCFAIVGGGGQGNHLGGAYAQQLRHAMGGSRYVYSALAQEKTMDFWVNGRLFGDQRVHCTEDVEHADYVLFIGCNPFQSHGIPNAREVLKEIKNDPNRTMVLVDPRISESARYADIHLQIKPGTDVFLLMALLAIIVQEGLHDEGFIKAHCTGFEELESILNAVDVEKYIANTELDRDAIYAIARDFAKASKACVRIDLGLQHSLYSTETAYLEKMLYILTGNFGKVGGNNLHAFLLPILSNSDERTKKVKLTARHKMMPISGLYPPNILPDEIEHESEDRIRAVWVESSNPVMTFADTAAYERAFAKLDLCVVVDVAMTETARTAHYVLPAASQYEKWEATGFNLEFPDNFFHLRKPVNKPFGDSLPEPEIYTRLLEKMCKLPKDLGFLNALAKYEPSFTKRQGFVAALIIKLTRNKKLEPYAASLMYRTLGEHLPEGAKTAAFLLPLSIEFARKHPQAVRRAGIQGNKHTLGVNLFNAILESHSGLIISKHEWNEMWSLIKTSDKKIHLSIDQVFDGLKALNSDAPHPAATNDEFPFVLMAGERRSYNANQIFRDPKWRKVDPNGALRIHPEDAKALGVENGQSLMCTSKAGALKVEVEVSDSVRQGMVTLPHGYGMRYQDSEPHGPQINRLTSSDHCEPFTKTPYHKYVPVRLEPISA